MTSRRVCTIIARNYWAHARVLVRSVLDVHPGAECIVLVVDTDAETIRAAEREPFEVLSLDDLGLSRDEARRMPAIYDVMELATATKPYLLRILLERDPSSVIYLDPDIKVFSSLDDAWTLADEQGIVLTPHNVQPLPEDGGVPSELTMLVSGVYNLGFIAVGASSRPFLDWWAERLARNGLNAQPEGVFVDQRWVDLGAGYFEPHVVRDPGWNVAFWNLATRDVDDNLRVDGSPLRFFHFSGFDPFTPDALSHFQGPDPRIRLEDRPVVARLCAAYADELLRAGYPCHSLVPYGFARSLGGEPLNRRVRDVYRDELIRAEAGLNPEPPNPFDPDESPGFVRWELDAQAIDAVRPALGVNVAGYMHAENGVGECARMLVRTLDEAGIAHAVIGFDETPSRQEAAFDAGDKPEHDINFVCVNADQFGIFASRSPELLKDRYTIGVWNWEVERMPASMAASTDLADEIWVASEHSAGAVRAVTDKPVHVFPIPVERRVAETRSRAELGLPEGFLFLFCFDFDSVFERKNPLGAIEAFSRAFQPGEGPQLVIKSVRGDAHPDQLEALRAAAASRPDVHVIDGYVSSDEQHALMASADAYVSLHRAEGFGLTIAEAMANGKPVIATGYSGNLTFMDETNSWPVPYTLVPIAPGNDPYPTDARWAEPDLDAAANAMREIVSQPDEARARGERASSDIERLSGPRTRAPFVLDRVEDITANRPEPAPAAREPRPMLDQSRPGAAELVEQIRELVARGPDIDSPSRMPGVSKRFRELVLRALRHHDEHRARVDETLIQAIEAIHTFEQNVRDELRRLYEIEDAADDLHARDEALKRTLDETLERVREMEGLLRSERRQRRELVDRIERLEGR